MNRAKCTCVVLSFLMLICPAALAHHLWVMSSGLDYVVARGLAPEWIDAYDPRHVVDVRALDEKGREIPVQRKDDAQRVRFSTADPAAMVAVTCNWGYRVNTPEGKKFLSKKQALAQGLTVVSAFESIQYTKSVFDHRIEWTRPLGLKLEIVALENPKDLTPGEALAVKVLFNGAPLAGCQVSVGKERRSAKTDENGNLRVRLENPGLQVLMAVHKVPVEGSSDIDYRQFMSFLTFNWP